MITTRDVPYMLESSMQIVRHTMVSTHTHDMTQLEETGRTMKAVHSVESSLRLDAVGSSGLSMSRRKFAKPLAKGLISHNQRVARSGSKSVGVANTISARGVGNVRVEDVSRTKRGRYRVSMARFV